MRSASIPVLLLAAFACAAQPRLSARQLRASLLRENLLWIAGGQQRSVPIVTVCLVTDPNRLIVSAAEALTSQPTLLSAVGASRIRKVSISTKRLTYSVAEIAD